MSSSLGCLGFHSSNVGTVESYPYANLGCDEGTSRHMFLDVLIIGLSGEDVGQGKIEYE